MGSMASAVHNFHGLPAPLQQDVIDTCIANSLLTWTTILDNVQNEITDPEYVISLINYHKHTNIAPTVPDCPV